MNVLLVTQYPVPHRGGLSTHVLDLVSCLRAERAEVHLIEGGTTKASLWRRVFRRLRYHAGSEPLLLQWSGDTVDAFRRCVNRTLGRHAFDLIHCHDPVAAIAVHEVLGNNGRRPLVVETVHGPLTYESRMMAGREIHESPYLQRLWDIEKTAYEKADHIIAVDTGQARIVTDDFGIAGHKVTVVFNCVSCDEISSVLAEPPRHVLNEPFLLVPRRLVRKNGVHVAIRAMAELADTDVRLAIAGDGPLQPELADFARECGGGDRIRFLGALPREEVLRLGKRALAVVVPSVPASGVVEATSIAALEAMACGTVVVASAIGGLAEIIRDGETGFLVPHGDAAALAGVVRRIRADAALRRQVAERAYQYIRRAHDRPVWYAATRRVYEQTLAGRGAGKSDRPVVSG